MDKKKVIITGATGMVGKGVLLECLDSHHISEVLVIGRTPISIKHEKLKEVIQENFSSYTNIKEQLKGYDACYFCLGISAAGLNEEQYFRITHDFTMTLAKTLYEINPNMTFIYVSGEGTDSSEQGRMMWARVKGQTENDLLKMSFHQAFMFRPGAIMPLRGIKSKTRSYQFFYDYFGWLLKVIKSIAPNSVCDTTQIGLAMINATLYGYNKVILKPIDIIALAKTQSD